MKATLWSQLSCRLQAAVVLNDILPSLKSMAHWIQDNDIQQVSISPGWVGREGSHMKEIGVNVIPFRG